MAERFHISITSCLQRSGEMMRSFGGIDRVCTTRRHMVESCLNGQRSKAEALTSECRLVQTELLLGWRDIGEGVAA